MLILPNTRHIHFIQQRLADLRLFAAICITVFGLSACERDVATSTDDRSTSAPDVMVSILPLKYFVERIAGESLTVSVMVEPGKSPEIYEPLPSQLAQLEHVSLFISIGVPFEQVWLPKIAAQNPDLEMLDLAPEDHSMHQPTGSHEGHHHHGHHMHHQQASHIWTDPVYALYIAELTHERLTEIYPQHEAVFTKNFEVLLDEILELDVYLEDLFRPYTDRGNFVVMHPGWEALADRYYLNQIAIEHEGKAPDARRLESLINELCWKNIQHIFVQPQYSPHLAETVAENLDAELVEIDPLGEDYLQNMRAAAEQLHSAMQAALGE